MQRGLYGIDNNCDTLVDGDDPSCAVCFVGQGGCRAGCASAPVGAPAWGWLALLAPLAGRARRRRTPDVVTGRAAP